MGKFPFISCTHAYWLYVLKHQPKFYNDEIFLQLNLIFRFFWKRNLTSLANFAFEENPYLHFKLAFKKCSLAEWLKCSIRNLRSGFKAKVIHGRIAEISKKKSLSPDHGNFVPLQRKKPERKFLQLTDTLYLNTQEKKKLFNYWIYSGSSTARNVSVNWRKYFWGCMDNHSQKGFNL